MHKVVKELVTVTDPVVLPMVQPKLGFFPGVGFIFQFDVDFL